MKTVGAQDGGMWNGRVYVSSMEGVDFLKIKAESGPGKVLKVDSNFGDYKTK